MNGWMGRICRMGKVCVVRILYVFEKGGLVVLKEGREI